MVFHKTGKPNRSCPKCPSTSKPINPIQGCKFLSGDEDTDFVLTGPLPLIWDRQYASNSPIGGNNTDDPIGFYGQGFGTPFSLSLNIRPNDDLIELVDAYGRIIPFPYMDVGSSFYSRFEDIRLHHDAQGRYRLTSGSSPKGDGIALHFGEGDDTLLYPTQAIYRCTGQSDTYGNTITLSYHQQANKVHLPQFIQDSMGRLIELEFNEIVNTASTTTKSQYRLTNIYELEHLSQDALNKLPSKPQQAFAQTHFGSHKTLAQNLINQGVLKQNVLISKPLVSYQYSEEGDLITVYRHQDSPSGLATTPSRLYDWQNHIMTAHHIPNGVSSYYVYDEYTITGKVIYNHINNGQTYHFDYFDDHTIVTEAKDTPHESCTIYHFNKDKRWTGITDAYGNHTAFILDDYDRLIEQIDPDGSVQTFDYTGNELTAISQLVDVDTKTHRPIWRTHRYLYQQGHLTEILDPNANSTHIQYDEYGQAIFITDANNHTTTLERDHLGRVIREILANGSSYIYTYDKAGNVLTQTDCSGFTTTYQYDEQGRLVQLTDPKGHHIRYQYDTHTHRTLEPTCIWYPDGTKEYFVYDELQRLITHKDPKGHQTCYEYDTDDLPSKRIDAQGNTLSYTYDNKRRLTKLTNENGEDWVFVYDKKDQLIKEIRFDGTTAHYDYTKAGKLKHEQDTGIHRYYRYNKVGELTDKYSLSDRLYHIAVSHRPKHKNKPHHLRYHYDIAGQLIQATSLDATTHLDFDPVGNLVKETLIRHHANQGQEPNKEVNSQTLTHTYDELGNRISTTLPDGTTLNNLYYGSGHLYNQSLTTIDQNGQPQTQELRHSQTNELHQEILREHGQGKLSHNQNPNYPNQSQPHHTAFDYDVMGRLTKQFTSNTSHIILDKTYAYDKIGQLTHITSHTRLDHKNTFIRTHQYKYDNISRLIEHKLSNHQAHTGHTEVFAFDPASNRVPLPNTSTSTNTSQAIHPKTKRPTSLISQNKQISYTYDSHGNIKTKTETPLNPKTGEPIYQSDNSLIGYRKSIEFSYNSNNELAKTLTLEDTGLTITKTTTQYHYDAFGRRIAKNSKVERLNKLNQNSQLVRYPTTLLHLSKTQKTQHQTTLMLWEGNRQIQEYTDQLIFTTVYDQDSFEPVSRIVQSRNKDCDDLKIYHYHNNHLGTPQELTDECGNVIWANYEFAWGGSYQSYYQEQSLNNIPIDKDYLQPIKFQGQFFDPETSLHYNRFRYYDSDVGMFIQRDPIELLGGYNIFQYAPNPIGWVDPLGLKKKISFGLFGDHARRHGNGLNPTQYRIVAEKHLHCSQIKVKFRHNKMTKLAHITKVGEDLFVFTSSNLSKTRIYTHMQEGVNSKYLQNIGITLPKKLSINC